MEWRVTIEVNGADGTKQTYEVARGGGSDPHSPLDPLGLTLDDGKTLLAGVQRHLVQGRVAEYSALRRRCSHCRGLRPLKDARTLAVEFAVRHDRGASTALQALPMRGYDAVDTLPGIGTPARPLHPRIRADIGEDGGLVAISLRPAVSVRVLPARC